MRPFLISIILGLSVFTSCSTPSSRNGSEDQAPESGPVARDARLETIAIVGTNDIHGGLAPMQLKTRESGGANPIEYQAGGMPYLSSYLKVLRKEFGPRLIWLDGGDEYQGTIESNANRGSAMVHYFNSAGLTAAAVGNHEFDFGADPKGSPDVLSSLKKRMAEAKYNYLAANIYDRATGELASFPNTLPSRIVDTGKIKIGVIGLSTVDTPRTTRPEYVAPLRFGDLKEATLREAKNLRLMGADAIVITAHAGLVCDVGRAHPGHSLRKASDPLGTCDSNEEIVQLLNGLPAGTVDAVVSGHTHTVVHHWINGIPVIQGGANGRFFNVIYLTFDTNTRKLTTDLTRIEGPVPVCPKIFQHQGDCNGDRPAPKNGRGPLVPAKFHRSEIHADAQTEELLKPVFAAAEDVKKEVWGQAAHRIEHERYKESPMGNLVADSLRVASKSDVAIVNAGGIRAPIEQGPITYGAIFRTLPFDNAITQLELTGAELRRILQIAESGSRGFPSVSGVRLKLIHPDYEATAKDLNGDDKIDPWEMNRLLEVRMADGSLLDDHKKYTLATLDFLVSGGDDFGWVMSQIPKERKHPTGVIMRDAAAQYIRTLSAKQGSINSEQHPLVNVADPRIQFEKVKISKDSKKKKKKKGKKKHHAA